MCRLSLDKIAGYREVDSIVLAQLPDGSKEAIVFLAEGEAEPSREAVFKIAEYLLLVARWLERERGIQAIVPVMVVVGDGAVDPRIRVGTDLKTYLSFECVVTQLARMDAEAALAQGNLAAAINVMNMSHTSERRVALLASALAVLGRLESPVLKRKYADYMMQTARLAPKERLKLDAKLSEGKVMIETLFTDYEKRGLEKGLALGKAEGVALGEARGEARSHAALLRGLLERKGFDLTAAQRKRVAGCRDVATLERWFYAALTARTTREVFATSRTRG